MCPSTGLSLRGRVSAFIIAPVSYLTLLARPLRGAIKDLAACSSHDRSASTFLSIRTLLKSSRSVYVSQVLVTPSGPLEETAFPLPRFPSCTTPQHGGKVLDDGSLSPGDPAGPTPDATPRRCGNLPLTGRGCCRGRYQEFWTVCLLLWAAGVESSRDTSARAS